MLEAGEIKDQIETIAGHIKEANSLKDLATALTSDESLDLDITEKLLNAAEDFGLADTRVGSLLLNTESYFSIPAFRVSYDISAVKVVQVPSVGLPVVTEVGLELNSDGIATFATSLNLPASTESDPFGNPTLQQAELKFEQNQPKIVLQT